MGAEVAVSDNGVGIPMDVLPHIFDPFFTTREVGEGTGLGLSMSYGIAQSHNGELRVETQPGEGTTFTLELPRAPENTTAEADAAEEAVAVEAGPTSRPLRILVVDDEVSVRDLAKRFLEKKGHRVDEADSGSAALRLVTANDYDSIVLDLRMPDLSGEGLHEWLRKNRPHLAERVTVISGDLANPQTAEIIERMGQPYLVKPFDLDELLEKVEATAPVT